MGPSDITNIHEIKTQPVMACDGQIQDIAKMETQPATEFLSCS